MNGAEELPTLNEVEVDESARRVLEDIIIDGLGSDLWRIRYTAISHASRTGLLEREDVRRRVYPLMDDPEQRVVVQAKRALGYDP